MLEFHEKRKLRSILLSLPMLLVLLVIVFGLAYAAWNVYEKERATRGKWQERRVELEGLRAREALLEEEIERLGTKRGVEEEVRKTFDVVKEGERVIVIVDPPERREDVAVSDKASFWGWVGDWFR